MTAEIAIRYIEAWAETETINEYPNNEWCEGFAQGSNLARKFCKDIIQQINN